MCIRDSVRIIQPDFVYVAEKNNKPVGFMICIPNMNEILIHNKRGRLLPWGIFRLWFGKSKIKTIRVLAMGVIEGYRKQGIEAVFMSNVIKEALKHNITCLLYTSPSPRDRTRSRMPSSA